MQLILHALGLLAALVVSFISSGMETAIYRVSRVRMRIFSDQGMKRASAVLAILGRVDEMVTAILINNNIAAYVGTYFLTMQLAIWKTPHLELITTAFITPLFFVFTESLPKQLAYNNADAWSLALVRVFAVLRRLLAPVVWILNRASALLRMLLGGKGELNLAQNRRSLLIEHFRAGVAEQVLSEEQNRMAAHIMELEGISVSESMIPLARLVRIPETASRREAIAAMAKRNSPLALLVDGAGLPTGEAVVMNDLVMRPGKPEEAVRAAAERLERIRAGVALPEALNLFRARHARYALVADHRRVLGLITSISVLDRIADLSR